MRIQVSRQLFPGKIFIPRTGRLLCSQRTLFARIEAGALDRGRLAKLVRTRFVAQQLAASAKSNRTTSSIIEGNPRQHHGYLNDDTTGIDPRQGP
jgi:hypothetical protein